MSFRHGRRGFPEKPGFTMVEIIVAVGLLGFSIMAIFGTLSLCSTASHHARMLNRSVLLAERLLVQTRLNPITVFEAREGQDGPYQWQVRIAPTPVEGLAAVGVTIHWHEQQRPQQYVLTTLARIMRPQRSSGLSLYAKNRIHLG